MFCEKLLYVLSFFCIVLQTHAATWVQQGDAEHELNIGFLEMKGVDVSSCNSEKQTELCQLGVSIQPQLYAAVEQRDDRRTTINVQLPSFPTEIGRRNPVTGDRHTDSIVMVDSLVSHSIHVIYCATHETDNDEYYFGQGPVENSIIVYFKGLDEPTAKVAGMFTDVYIN